MSDTTIVEVNSTEEIEVYVSRGWKTGIAVGTFSICWALIFWIVMYGQSDNSLHQSAMGWAFLVILGTLAGVGFGSIAKYLNILGQR